MRYIFSLMILAFILVLSSSQSHAGWLIYHKPEFRGRVIDAETKKPIEGAVVVVAYYKLTYYVIEKGTSLIYAKETLTDKNGEFYLPPYTTFIQPLSSDSYASFIIYKPGYGISPNNPFLNATDGELFFTKKIGDTGQLDGMVNGKNTKVKVTFGIVELAKLKTREERRKAEEIGLTDYKLPLLEKALEVERKNLGE